MKALVTALFASTMLLLATVQNSFAQFTGDFDHANWQTSASGGTVTTSSDELSLAGADGLGGSIDYFITVPHNVVVSFDWNYSTNDFYAYYDPAEYFIDEEHFSLTNSSYALTQSGSRVVYLEAGSTFGFHQSSNGWGGAATLSISNFTFDTTIEPSGGTSCGTAELINEGQEILTDNHESFSWYKLVIPNKQYQKLVLNLPPNVYANAYIGTCITYSYLTGGNGPKAVLTGFSPNDNVLLYLANYSGKPVYAWGFSIEDGGVGESCNAPIPATMGTNETIVPENTNYMWYSYTMPFSKKVVLNSTAGPMFDVFRADNGPCQFFGYVGNGYNKIEIADVAAGAEFLIRVNPFYSGNNFSWELTEEDFVEGDVCGSAIQASQGLNESVSDGGDSWFAYTMPDESNKKLVITSDTYAYVTVYSGTCQNLIYESDGWSNLTVTGLSAGEDVIIKWHTYSPVTLLWNLSIEDVSVGDLCSNPVTVNVDQENLVPSTYSDEFWYELVMPDEEKKLVVKSHSYQSFDVLLGSCSGFSYAGSFYESGQLTSLAPGTHLYIKWNLYNGGNFPFTVSFEDIEEAESCETAGTATLGENRLVKDVGGQYYYAFTMPDGVPKKLRVSSDGSHPVELYRGSCQNLDYVDFTYNNLVAKNIQPGETVYLKWWLNTSSDFTYDIQVIDYLPGEDCSAPIPVTWGANNTHAHQWFSFTMPGKGDITISSVNQAGVDTYLRVYTQCNAQEIASSDNYQYFESQVSLYGLDEGTTLLIRWDNYSNGAAFDWSITLDNVSQTITFDELPTHTIIDDPFKLTATTKSNLPITYVSENVNVAEVNGDMMTIHAIGVVKITATQAGDDVFDAALPVVRDLVITKAPQTISFDELPAKSVLDKPFDLTATTSSQLTLSFESSNPNVATVQGNKVAIVGLGETIITASQAGDGVYFAASPVTQKLIITKAAQLITFNPPASKNLGDPDFQLAATSSTNLPITFESSNTAVATIAGNTVKIVGRGLTRLIAKQSGDNTYAATVVERPLVVMSNQNLTFGALSPKTFGDGYFTLSASSDTDLPVSFESSDPEIASVSGNTVTILHAGTVTITAKQDGNAFNHASPKITRTLVINKKPQQITFSALPNRTLGDSDFAIAASSSESLLVTYVSSDAAIGQVTGSIVTMRSAGSVTITVSQPGTNDIAAAESVSRTFCVNPRQPQITSDFNDSGAPVLTSSVSSGNQWYENGQVLNGATGQTLTVSSGGKYSVVANAGSCSSSQSESFTILVTDIQSKENNITVYPNPATNFLSIEGITDEAQLEVVSMQGLTSKRNFRSSRMAEKVGVDISDLTSGVYYLVIRENALVTRVKFVKQ